MTPQDSLPVFTDPSSTGFIETWGSGASGAGGPVRATVQGTRNIVISPPAYGSASFTGQTLVLNINAGGNVTFTANAATNFASQAAFLAALLTTFTALSSATVVAAGVLSMVATTSIEVVSGSADLLAALGLSVQTSTGTTATHYANNIGVSIDNEILAARTLRSGLFVPAFRGIYSAGGGDVKVITPYQAAQIITLPPATWWTQKAFLGLTVYGAASDVLIGF